MTEPQKAAEVKRTLERKASEWRQENFAITDLWCDERVAAFACEVLAEARRYMRHKPECKVTIKYRRKGEDGIWRDDPCDCGLAEFQEGWR